MWTPLWIAVALYPIGVVYILTREKFLIWFLGTKFSGWKLYGIWINRRWFVGISSVQVNTGQGG